MQLNSDLCLHYLQLNYSKDFLCEHDDSVQVQLPYPITKPSKDGKDLINQYEEDLYAYNKEFAKVRRDFCLSKEPILNQDFTESHATLTNGLLNFCNREKPEMQFIQDYNPYYSMGLLEHLVLNDTSYLIFSTGCNNLKATSLSKPWKNKSLRLNSDINDSITGLSVNKDTKRPHIIVKYKKDVNVFRIKDLHNTDVIWSKRFAKRILYSKLHRRKIGVVLTDLQLHLFDLQTAAKLFTFDDVLRFEFVDKNSIMTLNKERLQMMDLRSNSVSFLCESKSNSCNNLTAFKFNNDFIYAATRHHLMRVDRRMAKAADFCTHFLKNSPCYLELDENLLVLSSQKNDQVLFSGNPISTLPWEIPNIRETLNQCKLHKETACDEGVNQRLESSIGGIKLIDSSLYSANILGDIFKHRVTSKSHQNDFESVEALQNWINLVPRARKLFRVTDFVDATEVRLVLGKDVRRKVSTQSKRLERFISRNKVKYRKDSLGGLGANFAAIWDDDEEEEERSDVHSVPEVAAVDKVSNWIESSYFFDEGK